MLSSKHSKRFVFSQSNLGWDIEQVLNTGCGNDSSQKGLLLCDVPFSHSVTQSEYFRVIIVYSSASHTHKSKNCRLIYSKQSRPTVSIVLKGFMKEALSTVFPYKHHRHDLRRGLAKGSVSLSWNEVSHSWFVSQHSKSLFIHLKPYT